MEERLFLAFLVFQLRSNCLGSTAYHILSKHAWTKPQPISVIGEVNDLPFFKLLLIAAAAAALVYIFRYPILHFIRSITDMVIA